VGTAVAYDLHGRAARPGWLRTIAGVLYGGILAGVALLLPALLLAREGGVFPSTGGRRPPGILTGPFYADSAWAAAADLAVAAVVVGVAAACVAYGVRAATGRSVSWTVLAVALAVTGAAPYLELHAPAPAAAAALAATIVVVRFAASERVERRPLPWRAALVALSAAVLVVASYALVHPLRVAGAGQGAYVRGGAQHAMVELRNGSPWPVSVLGLSEPAFSGQLGRRFPLRGLAIPAGGRAWVTFARPGCPPVLVTLRYVLRGHELTQPLTLTGPCP
jgi:hypothetical protein